MCRDPSNVRLVHHCEVVASDIDDLEIFHNGGPAAVLLAGGVGGLEGDGVVVVLVGHVQRHMPAVLLQLGCLNRSVVEPRCALMLDDSARDLRPTELDQVGDDANLASVVPQEKVGRNILILFMRG